MTNCHVWYQHKASRDIRNTVVHGSSILRDIEVIKAFDDVESCQRVIIWKKKRLEKLTAYPSVKWRSGRIISLKRCSMFLTKEQLST
jgi:hypothetical protein